MMARVNNSVDTVNAAAAAIVTAESRVQPASVQKRRWGGCWNLYWCFGSLKASKRISHAALVPEPTVTESSVAIADNPNPSTSTVRHFIAPPSSPTSFQQSDPPTATHSPGGLLTIAPRSVNSFSSGGHDAHLFTIGPYAHETQLVSPPVFSAFTTEPSTAAVTPPPEPMQSTTPSSPEVPFAQLLTSSLNRARRYSGSNHKFALSCYEVHHLISPGSTNSASGTSSPYFDKRPVLEFRMVDASKLFDSKKFSTKWGSRLGSGSLTPDSGVGFAPYYNHTVENQISEVASLANSETGSPIAEALVDHRVSFELCQDDIPICFETKVGEGQLNKINDLVSHKVEDCCLCNQEVVNVTQETTSDSTEVCQHKKSSVSLGSAKEFNFDSSNGETTGKSNLSSEWWSDEKVGKDIEAQKKWTFFPLLQPGVS